MSVSLIMSHRVCPLVGLGGREILAELLDVDFTVVGVRVPLRYVRWRDWGGGKSGFCCCWGRRGPMTFLCSSLGTATGDGGVAGTGLFSWAIMRTMISLSRSVIWLVHLEAVRNSSCSRGIRCLTTANCSRLKVTPSPVGHGWPWSLAW